jgi:predicted nucleotidyltransferase component of viral defense system
MLSFQTVVPHTLELLTELMDVPLFSEMRLVGGTALALQYGHRQSVDLDFFGKLSADVSEIHDVLANIGSHTIYTNTQNIKIFEVNGVKVDFVNYIYDWIDDIVTEGNLRLASPKDIAAMKVNAIEGRGSRKDFIDIYFLLKHFTLNEILEFYKQKYPEHSVFRALMSLNYFDDAEQQVMPKMLVPFDWNELKEKLKREVDKLT